VKYPNWVNGLLWGLLGAIAAGVFLLIQERRIRGKNGFACWVFGHVKPVYHISRAYWWCGRCNKTLGMNPDLWTLEAMAEHSEMMRRPDRN